MAKIPGFHRCAYPKCAARVTNDKVVCTNHFSNWVQFTKHYIEVFAKLFQVYVGEKKLRERDASKWFEEDDE